MLKLVLHDGDEETWTEILGDAEFAHGELKRPVNSSSDETACRCYCMPISSNADLPNTPPMRTCNVRPESTKSTQAMPNLELLKALTEKSLPISRRYSWKLTL
jgi:hypothetical protein